MRKLTKSYSHFNCVKCDRLIAGPLERIGYSSTAGLGLSLEDDYQRVNLVPRGYYALSDDLPWDTIQSEAAPPDGVVFFWEDVKVKIRLAQERDQGCCGLRGTYGPNMSCEWGTRIATGISECGLVNYVYAPLRNLRYTIYAGRDVCD